MVEVIHTKELNLHICHLVSQTSSRTFPVCLMVWVNTKVNQFACVHQSVRPVAQPHRRIPFHVRKQVVDKLRQLENEDIIERAEGPTPWVSPIVVVPKPSKPNEVRISVDTRFLNQAIIRERHVIPTIDDVMSDLNGCKVFSKIDLNQGYHKTIHDVLHSCWAVSLQAAELWSLVCCGSLPKESE